MRFEEKLRKEMLLKGFNQQRLARASQVSDSEVSRILAGKSQPGLENAMRLAQSVGVSLDYLADDTRDFDPARQGSPKAAEERELLELARDLGYRETRRILESANILGYDVAIRRLHGAEMRPTIEVGDGTNAPATAPTSHGRANTA